MEVTELGVTKTLTQFMVQIADHSSAGEARRAAISCATSLGMNETDCGKISIAVTELATNIVKHAERGKILCEPLAQNGSCGLRVLALDKGSGIRDISAALRDGYSTAGTPGNGLGAVRRLASRFDVYSAPQRGTCVLTEFWPQGKIPTSNHFVLGVVSVPMRGELACGDGWGTRPTADRSFFMVVDGLGHGIYAAEAAREAEKVLADSRATSAEMLLRDCHDALKKTRGAAGAIASISQEKGTLVFSGIGNISSVVLDGENRRGIASHNGILGHQVLKFQEFTVPWNSQSVLIMHSDGLTSKWDLNEYPGLASKHPSIIAAVLYRDFERERDDVTVLAAKNFVQ
jgi:anti-sigma regulatory factor (Ser/Thr protein kinase)